MTNPAQTPKKTLLTVPEIAGELKISKKTIYYWVSRSEIPFLKIGRHLRFERDAVFQYYAEKMQETFPCLSEKPLLRDKASTEEVPPLRSLTTWDRNSA